MTSKTDRVRFIAVNRDEMVPCKHCGEMTRMLGSKECDNCHEVFVRIRMMNDLGLLNLNVAVVAEINRRAFNAHMNVEEFALSTYAKRGQKDDG